MSVLHLNQESFQKEVLESKEPVLVDFYASWCGPCKMLAPIIEEVANEANGFKVFKLDVDAEEALAAQYGVQTIPTLIVFKDGKPVQSTIGFKPKNQVIDLVKNV